MMMFSWLLFLVGGAWLVAWLLQRDRRQMNTRVGPGPSASRDLESTSSRRDTPGGRSRGSSMRRCEKI